MGSIPDQLIRNEMPPSGSVFNTVKVSSVWLAAWDNFKRKSVGCVPEKQRKVKAKEEGGKLIPEPTKAVS